MYRIAVLISGEGTNLQALIDTVHGKTVEIVGVASSCAEARGLERARAAGIETSVFALADYAGALSAAASRPGTRTPPRTAAAPPAAASRPDTRTPPRTAAAPPAVTPATREARDRELGDWLDAHEVELVVLAGFMELLSPAFIRRFANRILNVHPSLLPAFTGIRAIEQALDYGARVLGVTVHLVDEGVDTGPIVLQEAFAAPYSRDIAEAEQLTHEVEHRLLPRAVELFAQGRVRVDPGSRIVEVDDGGG